MTDDQVVDLFAALFEGNSDRIGTEEGGSVETKDWWIDVIYDHLAGTSGPIGAYPIDPRDGQCKWGCVDIDEGDEDSWVHAQRVAYVLQLHEVAAWIERSRSKGYHVWIFSQDWVSARTMRRALLYACEFVGAPTREINPKQERLGDGQVGNYVRLPYPAALCDDLPNPRRVMVNPATGELTPLQAFVSEAWWSRCDPAALQDLAKRYEPPAPAARRTAERVGEIVAGEESCSEEAIQRLSRDARRLFEHGPKVSDRSSALVALGGVLARDAIHGPDEMVSILREADRRWGKYAQRGDAEIRIDEIVERVMHDKDSLY